MTYIPNEDKPCEADQINQHLNALHNCHRTGVWDMAGVMKWLEANLPQITDAADRMAEYLEQQFPGAEYDREDVAAEAQREYVWNLKQSIDKGEVA